MEKVGPILTLVLSCIAWPAFAAPSVGHAAPSLTVTELQGQAFKLEALRGDVVIIHLWATWCPPCLKEMPALDAFYQSHHTKGLKLIGLSVDRPNFRDQVRKIMQSFHYSAAMLNEATDNGFGIPMAIPITYVVDRRGILRAALTPVKTPISERALSDIVLPLLRNERKAVSK